MVRNAILWLCIAAAIVAWGLVLLDDQTLARVAQMLKSQDPRHLGLITALAVAVAAGIYVLAGKSSSTGRSAKVEPYEVITPAIVTPKRVANQKLQVRDRITQDVGLVLSNGIEVRHLMSEHLESVHPDTKLIDVKKLMEEEGIRHLAVTKPGEYGDLAGIISDRDVASRRGGYARDIMTPAPVTICHGAKIQEAVDMMADRGISCLPVRRGEVICGILTTTDLIIGLRATYELLRTLVPDERLAAVSSAE